MEATARLLIRLGSQPEQEYSLTQDVTILGRETINDLVVNDPEVSRRHCRVMLEADGYIIEDLGSTNGTFVNGQRITAPIVLYHGDTVELGKYARIIFLGSAPRANQREEAAAAPPPPPAAEPPPSSSTRYKSYEEYDQQYDPDPYERQHAQDEGYEDEYEEYEEYEEYDRRPQQSAEHDQYYVRPDDDPIMVSRDDDYLDDEEPEGCQRYFIGCGCLLLLFLFLLGATLFIMDQLAPDLLYCGPLQGFWETVMGPVLGALGAGYDCSGGF